MLSVFEHILNNFLAWKHGFATVVIWCLLHFEGQIFGSSACSASALWSAMSEPSASGSQLAPMDPFHTTMWAFVKKFHAAFTNELVKAQISEHIKDVQGSVEKLKVDLEKMDVFIEIYDEVTGYTCKKLRENDNRWTLFSAIEVDMAKIKSELAMMKEDMKESIEIVKSTLSELQAQAATWFWDGLGFAEWCWVVFFENLLIVWD